MKKKQLVREKFRDSVFKRDHHKCKRCGVSSAVREMDAHHVTNREEMPNGGYVVDNGITLCNEAPEGETSCHMLAEKFHSSGGTEWEPGMHPNDLYNLIGSSYEKAIKASERLK